MLNIRRGIGRVGVVSLVLWELITLSGGSKTTTAHFLMPSPLDCRSIWLSSFRSSCGFAGACCSGSDATS